MVPGGPRRRIKYVSHRVSGGSLVGQRPPHSRLPSYRQRCHREAFLLVDLDNEFVQRASPDMSEHLPYSARRILLVPQ